MADSSAEQRDEKVGSEDGDSFAWDEASQLYYHARSGFYHDPNAGWYYNSIDGSYYKFEDGSYVLLDSCQFQGSQSETRRFIESSERPFPDLDGVSYASPPCGNGVEGSMDYSNDGEQEYPPPTSEWLEDTLIELYLNSYSHGAPRAADDVELSIESEEKKSCLQLVDGAGDDIIHEREGAEQTMCCDMAFDSSENFVPEAISLGEENWRAQYGQVIRHEGESMVDFPVVNLWDWARIRESKKDGKDEVLRLLGRLTQPSTKLHPSMSSSIHRLKTSPILEVNLDLVRVRSGQIYRLRTPNTGYLTTLSSYDASNPTKDWGFPELAVATRSESNVSEVLQVASYKKPSSQSDRFSKPEKINLVYRDRAAERRVLHGGYGVAPGQEYEIWGCRPTSPVSMTTAEAASEALDFSLGAGSYARRMLENMGWREGQGLGKAKQGLKEPLQAVGNKGCAGLGWH